MSLLASATVAMALLLATTHWTSSVDAREASSIPRWDDPQACEWDLKICGDGTWVYPDPKLECGFPECWVKFQTPTPAPTGDTYVA